MIVRHARLEITVLFSPPPPRNALQERLQISLEHLFSVSVPPAMPVSTARLEALSLPYALLEHSGPLLVLHHHQIVPNALLENIVWLGQLLL